LEEREVGVDLEEEELLEVEERLEGEEGFREVVGVREVGLGIEGEGVVDSVEVRREGEEVVEGSGAEVNNVYFCIIWDILPILKYLILQWLFRFQEFDYTGD
jgi:hypothetical protein